MRVFNAPVDGGTLGGWVTGEGSRVLLLHGGPGLSFSCLDGLVDELGTEYEIASYQQRGLPPSMTSGPYDVATAVADVAAVLDHLDWPTAYVVGHSWGGHLALHVAVSLAHRADAVMAIDPLGGVGDGGEQGLEAAFAERVPAAVAEKAQELDERAMRGEGTDADALEAFRMVWPGYFADWDTAPPCPDDLRISVPAYAEGFESIHAELPRLEKELPSITMPVGFLVGTKSPIPPSASYETAERIPGAWVEAVDEVGHFPWLERPGCVRPALQRLVAG